MPRWLLISALLAPLWLVGAANVDPERFDTVVLDAGHGGEDEGARGPGAELEKDVVLDVVRRLAVRLRAAGVRVVLTRSDDRYVPLEERTAIANDSRGDVLVSVHANASRSETARGIEAYFLSLEASDAGARDLVQRENAALGRRDPVRLAGDDALLSVLGDMMQTEHVMESDELSRLVHRELAGLERSPGRGVKQAPFVVLMGLQMPACLVEAGFITNPEDARWLGSTRRREEIAKALARAILEFGRRYDARRGRLPVEGGG